MYVSKQTYVLLQLYHHSLFSSSTSLHVILRISAVSLLAIRSAKFSGQSKLSSAHLFLKSVLTPSEALHSITFWTGVSTFPQLLHLSSCTLSKLSRQVSKGPWPNKRYVTTTVHHQVLPSHSSLNWRHCCIYAYLPVTHSSCHTSRDCSLVSMTVTCLGFFLILHLAFDSSIAKSKGGCLTITVKLQI